MSMIVHLDPSFLVIYRSMIVMAAIMFI